jgi:hypothetical protein
MKMEQIRPELYVLTKPEDTCSILASPKLLSQRRRTQGIVLKRVTGTDYAWWVRHPEDETRAPYFCYELEEDTNPPEEDFFSLT